MLEDKRGQVTIFIIIAIIIVAGLVTYFLVRGNIAVSGVPAEFRPVYDYYSECIKTETKAALDLAGTQSGHVYVPEYIPGSEYAPFSSQLNFLGFPVPYWYYVSGNGIIKEQMPTKKEIEKEIAQYVKDKIANCDFESFSLQGFVIEREEGNVNVKIEEEKVNVEVNAPLSVSKEERTARQTKEAVIVESKFGKFYRMAQEIYQKEKEDSFLENYTIDTLRLYAPVDGVELSCSPKIWKTQEIVNDLNSGLEANIGSLKLDGDYYSKNSKSDNYFVLDMKTDERVNFVYSRNWPYKIALEGNGVDQDLVVAEPIGNQEGLGVLGFCYIPYHFVYDLGFPVLIQSYDDNELFQFPVAVIIDKNVPRQAAFSEFGEDTSEVDVCQFNTQDVNINVYDSNLNPVDANISYICFNQQCRIGESKGGSLSARVPACLNGYLQTRAEGYSEKTQLFSSNKENKADVILDREYELDVSAEIDGKESAQSVILSFKRIDDEKITTLALPDVKKIKLSEGNYEVTAYVYGNTSIVIPATSKEECRNVPKGGILGLFGSTREECFNIDYPESKIDSAIIGGGKSESYLLSSDLEKGRMIVSLRSLPKPDSLEQLQYNFAALDSQPIDLEFQ